MQSSSLLSAAVCAFVAVAVFLPGQAPGQAENEEQKLQASLATVAAQQKLIAENQDKIDQKIAEIGEEVRQARIFAGRAGGKAK